MTEGQEKGLEIAKKMQELQSAFEEQLNRDNDRYREARDSGDSEEVTAETLAKSEVFICEYLYNEAIELVKSILNADVYGMYYAGFVPFAKSPTEYKEESEKQIKEYYSDLNREIAKGIKKDTE